MNSDFLFIIPSFCNTQIHLIQLERCLNSIRKFHNNKIIVIDDHSPLHIKDITSKFENIELILSPNKGAGDMSTYEVFLNETSSSETAVIFQDSMTLESALEHIEQIKDINYIWYFTNHRLLWDKIKEEQTQYNLLCNIQTHDDLIKHCIFKFSDKIDFKNFIQQHYHEKDKWSGCFGCLSIINKQFLKLLNEKTDIIQILKHMNNNRTRRAAESVFSLACTFVLGDKVLNKAYDGLFYDGINPPNNRTFLNGESFGFPPGTTLNQFCKNKYFSKIVFNRNE